VAKYNFPSPRWGSGKNPSLTTHEACGHSWDEHICIYLCEPRKVKVLPLLLIVMVDSGYNWNVPWGVKTLAKYYSGSVWKTLCMRLNLTQETTLPTHVGLIHLSQPHETKAVWWAGGELSLAHLLACTSSSPASSLGLKLQLLPSAILVLSDSDQNHTPAPLGLQLADCWSWDHVTSILHHPTSHTHTNVLVPCVQVQILYLLHYLAVYHIYF
jgi:hypothetical protein